MHSGVMISLRRRIAYQSLWILEELLETHRVSKGRKMVYVVGELHTNDYLTLQVKQVSA